MKSSILNLALVLTVSVILVGTLLVPVISDANKEVRTTYTNGTETSPHYDSGAESYTLALSSGPVLAINGETVDTTSFSDYMILAATNSIVVFWRTSGAFTVWEVNGVSHTYGAGSYDFENGTLTQTIGTTDTTFSYDAIYTYADDGDYVYVPYTSAPYVSTELDDFYALGYVANTTLSVYNNGTVYVNGSVSADTQINADTDSVNAGVCKLNALSIGTVGGQNLIVKQSYTVAIENADGILALLSVLPLLVIVALVLLPVGVILARRNE